MSSNVILVRADSLATLLLLDKSLEPIPEPFRCQKNLCCIVEFEEYCKFLDRYLANVDYLATPTYLLKQYLRDGSEIQLRKAFYKDMAYAVCKELHYAERKHTVATRIIHTLRKDSLVTTANTLDREYLDVCNDTVYRIYQKMDELDFALPARFHSENFALWQYANLLYHHGTSFPVAWKCTAIEGGLL